MTFERFLGLSLIFHLVVAGILSIPVKKKYDLPPAFQIKLLAGDPDVPIRKAPQVKEAPPPAPKAKEEPVKEAKKPAAPPVKKAEAKSPVANTPAPPEQSARQDESERQAVEDRILAMRAKHEIAKRVKLRETVHIGGNARKPELKPAPAGGMGGRQTGDPTYLQQYASKVGAEIRKNWFYPDMRGEGLYAEVSVIILADGMLVMKDFERKSGNPLFDNSIGRAISRTGKVEPPPFELETVMRFSPDRTN